MDKVKPLAQICDTLINPSENCFFVKNKHTPQIFKGPFNDFSTNDSAMHPHFEARLISLGNSI